MKKIFFSIVALAALAACSKTEVAYEAPAEIGFAPVKGNITKAEGLYGDLDPNQELGVWAFWDKDGVVEGPTETTTDGNTITTPITYNKYNESYLANALFVNGDEDGTSWGAPENKSYPWPVNGSLVFAGYTTPGDDVLTTGTADGNVQYDFTNDVMTFTNYQNTTEFDLCWFGRTDESYNNRTTGTAVSVDLNHALTWVTIAAYAQNAAIGWKITSMTLNNYNVAGTATCNGSTKKATWNTVTLNQSPLSIGTTGDGGTLPHTLEAATGSKGVELSDNVLIPSNEVKLTVNFSFLVNGVEKTDSKTFTLNTTTTWESGVHYTYTLVFNSNEILLTPSYEEWTPGGNDITV